MEKVEVQIPKKLPKFVENPSSVFTAVTSKWNSENVIIIITFVPILLLAIIGLLLIKNDHFKCNSLNWKTYIYPCEAKGMIAFEELKEVITKTDELNEKLETINAVKQYDLPIQFTTYLTTVTNETLSAIIKNEHIITFQIKLIEKCVRKNVANNLCGISSILFGFYFVYFIISIAIDCFVRYYCRELKKGMGDSVKAKINTMRGMSRTMTIWFNVIVFFGAAICAYFFPFFPLTKTRILNSDDC